MKIPKSSGIYLLKCLKTGKIYIGKAINIYQRIHVHIYSGKSEFKSKGKSLIVDAIKKYGWNNFEVKILELVNKNTPSTELFLKESLWIKFYDSANPKFGYNIQKISIGFTDYHPSLETRKKLSEMTKGENNPFYGKRHSQETKNKISQGHIKSGRYKGENNHFFGKHHSEKTKKKISETKRNNGDSKGEKNFMFGKTHSKEILDKIKNSDGYKNRDFSKFKKPIKQIDKNTGEIIKIWDWVKTAVKELNLPLKAIFSIRQCCLKDKVETSYGFKWEYVERPKPKIENQRLKFVNSIKKSINQLDLEGNFIKRWESMTEVGKVLNLKHSSALIGRAIKENKPFKNFKWEYTGK